MLHSLFTKIATIIATPILLLGSLFTPAIQNNNVGATLPQSVGIFETSLVAPITSTATSMTLTANAIRGGGSISGYNCFTIDEGTSNAEIACGTVSSTAVTSMTRGISYADGTTSVAGNKFSHRRGANVKITDYPIINILKQQNNGEATFPNKLSYESAPTFSSGNEIVTKTYVDGVTTAGAPDSSTSTKGITKMSVAPVSSTAPIAVGDNDTRVPTQGENDALVGDNTDIAVGTGNKFVTQTGLQHNAEKYAADAGANDTYVITLSTAPTSYTDGMVVYFKANTANTGAATINVNGLGAKTIVKGVNTTLADGDIAALSFNTLIYDGINFVLQNPIANVVTMSSTSGVSAGPGSSSTQTITHGLGKTPSIIRIHGVGFANAGASSSAPSVSNGTYNSSGNKCSYVTYTTGAVSGTPSSSSVYAIYLQTTASGGGIGTGVIGNITSTTFDIVWTTSGSTVPNDTTFIWEAQ